MLYHDVQAVRAWPESARDKLLAVAKCDVGVARQNLADMTRYVDIYAAHLAACSGALDDSLPRRFPMPRGESSRLWTTRPSVVASWCG